MPTSRCSHRPLLLGLFILIMSPSLSKGTNITFEQPDVLKPVSVDCQSPPPSPSPSPSPPSNTTENSTFWSNVLALLSALPSHADSRNGFASDGNGLGADQAFVRGLCRGDALGECESCLMKAAQAINDRCGSSSSRRAGIWYDKCFVSYADTNASTAQELQFRSILYNTGEVRDKDAFETTYYALMRQLTARVVNGSGSSPMFATGEAVYDAAAPNGAMYGLLQCMRDRTPAECEQCLQDSVEQLPGCCYGNQGGVVLGYNCYLRVEIYTYYDLALDALFPPPLLSPSPSTFMPFNGERQGELAISPLQLS